MHRLLSYVVAIGAVLAAWGVTALAWDLIRPAVALFFAAVMVAAWYGGFGPGLLACVLAAVLSEVLLAESFHVDAGPRAALRLGVFLLSALLINWLNAQRRRVENALRRVHGELEQRVDQRTAELRTAVDTLRQEVRNRERADRDVRAHQERLRELASELSLAEQRQRRQIAMELHDGIGQLLFTAEIRVDLLEDRLSSCSPAAGDMAASFEEIRNLLGESIRRTRSLTVELSPPVLYEAGFGAAVRWLASHMRDRFGTEISVECEADPEPVPEELRVFLFQAVRELLANMGKHSGARTGRVVIRRDGSGLRIAVEDDGTGFDAAAAFGAYRVKGGEFGAASKNSFGLFNIHERLKHVGGSMEVDSAPGRGARFVLIVPNLVPTPAFPAVVSPLGPVRWA